MPTPNTTDATILSINSTPSSSSSNNKWGPYSSAKDFLANMAMVLAILLCVTILAFSLTTAIRSFLRRRRRRLRRSRSAAEMEKPSKAVAIIDALPPSLLFSAGTRLAGAEPECAICLAEFVEGDRVRVLPACKHGFHTECIEAWLKSSSSCPTCRSSCRPAAEPQQSLPEEP